MSVNAQEGRRIRSRVTAGGFTDRLVCVLEKRLMINEEIVKESLKKVIEQKSGKNVIALGIISSIVIKGRDVGFALEISRLCGQNFREAIQEPRQNLENP